MAPATRSSTSKNTSSNNKNKTEKTKKPARKRKKTAFKIPYTNKKAARLLSSNSNNELSKEEICSMTFEDKLKITSWSLPPSIVWNYKKKGLTHFFEWQVECLANEKVLEGTNLLYSAPTSAGKTLVAEILMVKRVLELGKKAIMILPFVSVAREKMYSLQEQFGDSGIRVEGFMGTYSPPGGFKTVDIAICTIEKANSLINRLLEDNELSQLGTIVVDELHLIGDSSRGYLLELLLTKIRFMSEIKILKPESDNEYINKYNIQIIGMSATLPNLKLLSDWLNAELVISDFRPVPLLERIKIGDKLFDNELNEIRPVKDHSLNIEIEGDSDDCIYLTLETILNGNSVLIFCPTKNNCETVAKKISLEFFKIGNPSNTSKYPEVSEKLRNQLSTNKIKDLLEQLKQCPAGLDKDLGITVSFGVAFHHAGITYDERDIIESAFKKGVLKVIVATSTLSAGVNLPARRVIIVTPMFLNRQMDSLVYKQMSGRAGRKGVDTEGESILICSDDNKANGINLIQSSLPHVKSTLLQHKGELSSAIKRAILEVIASKVSTKEKDIYRYSDCTLLSRSIEETKGMENSQNIPETQEEKYKIIKDCLEFLEAGEFIRILGNKDEDNEREYMSTLLGNACLASSLPPDEGIIVHDELNKARQCFVLENELHIVYQVTPIFVADQWTNINWTRYLKIWESLSDSERRVGKLIGIDYAFILKGVHGGVSNKNINNRTLAKKRYVHQRFYTAMALNDLVNEKSIRFVSNKYEVSKGVIQNLQQSASSFAGMVTAFCNRLGWSNIELLLSQFQQRLEFGIQRELCDLVRLSLLNGSKARILYNAGIKEITDLAKCEPSEIEKLFHKSVPFQKSNKNGEHEGNNGVYIQGKEILSEGEAAIEIVKEARTFVKRDLGLSDSHELFGAIKTNNTNNYILEDSDDSSFIEEEANNENINEIEMNSFPNIINNLNNQVENNENSKMSINELGESNNSNNINKNHESQIEIQIEDCDIFEDSLTTDYSKFDMDMMMDTNTNFNENEVDTNSNKTNNADDVEFLKANQGNLSVLFKSSTTNGNNNDSDCSLDFDDVQEIECKIRKKDLQCQDCSKNNNNSSANSNSTNFSNFPSHCYHNISSINDKNMNKIETPNSTRFNINNNSIKHSTPVPISKMPKPILNKSIMDHEREEYFRGIFTQEEKKESLEKNDNSTIMKMNFDIEILTNDIQESLGIADASDGDDTETDFSEQEEDANDDINKKLSESDMACANALALNEQEIPPSKTQRHQDSEDMFEEFEDDEVMNMNGSSRSNANCHNNNIGSEELFFTSEEKSSNQEGSKNDSNNTFGEDLFESRKISGKVLSVKKVQNPNSIPKSFFDKEKHIGIGLKLTFPKKTIGIGARVVERHRDRDIPSKNNEEEEFFYSIVLFNGGENILSFQWTPSDEKYFNAKNKLSELFQIIKNSECPVVLIDTKESIKKIVKYCGQENVFANFPESKNIWDPKIAQWLLRSNLDDKYIINTESLIDQYIEISDKNIKSFGWPKEIVDSFFAYKIMEKLRVRLQEAKLLSHFIEIEMPCVKPLILMELNGFRVDFKEMERLKKILQFKSSLLELRAFEIAKKEFKLSSPKEIRQVLFRDIGLKQPKKKGTGKDVLAQLNHEIANVIIEWRKVTSALQKTVLPFLQEKNNEERIHGYYSHFTVSGRLICSDPSLQCVPRDFDLKINFDKKKIEDIGTSCRIRFGSKLNYLLSKLEEKNLPKDVSSYTNVSMRSVFISSSEQFVLLSADYAQLELRILAHLAKDDKLTKAINNKEADVFVSIASEWKNIPIDQITSSMRHDAKELTYGIIYGMGSRALSEKMDIDENEACQFKADFMKTYTGIFSFLDKTVKFCQENGYIETISGRRRYLPNINCKDIFEKGNEAKIAKAERQAINSRIQGSASDLVKKAMTKIQSKLESLYPGSTRPALESTESGRRNSTKKKGISKDMTYFPILNLHDELMFEVRKDSLKDIAKVIRDSMENAMQLSLKFPVILKTGTTWASMKIYNEDITHKYDDESYLSNLFNLTQNHE